MTFKQSQITFGAYTFPAGFRVQDLGNDTVIEEVKVPFIDGTSAPPGSRNSKTIHLVGYVGGFGAVDSSGNYITTSDQCENECQLMSSYLESGYQELSFGQSPARYIMAQKQKFTKTPVEGTQRRCVYVEVELLAQDPRWLSSTAHAENIALVAGAAASVTASNAGTTVAYPKLTIICSGTGASIVNPSFETKDASGNALVLVALKYTMVPGDVLQIDCDPRNRPNAVLLNGVARLDLLGTSGITNYANNAAMFPYLLAGDGSAIITTAAGSAIVSSTASVSWQDAWL